MREQRREDGASPAVIYVKDFYRTCATRERAKKFYPALVERLADANSRDEIVLSFEDVEFVSPSFLDETLVRLAEDQPETARRVVLRSLSDFAITRLKRILSHRGLSWTLRPRASGEYELSA